MALAWGASVTRVATPKPARSRWLSSSKSIIAPTRLLLRGGSTIDQDFPARSSAELRREKRGSEAVMAPPQQRVSRLGRPSAASRAQKLPEQNELVGSESAGHARAGHPVAT